MDYFVIGTCFLILLGFIWVVARGRKFTEEAPVLEDGETCFVNYLKHTDPLSGAIQDKQLARQHLLKAVHLDHPDATFVYGTLIYTGDMFTKDTREGMRLMREGRSLGASMTDVIATSMGIDLDTDSPDGSGEFRFSGENIGIACRNKIDELHENKKITDEHQQDLYELVRTLDKMHLVNVLGILHNDEEMKTLAGRASRISGWDGERGIFFLSNNS